MHSWQTLVASQALQTIIILRRDLIAGRTPRPSHLPQDPVPLQNGQTLLSRCGGWFESTMTTLLLGRPE